MGHDRSWMMALVAGLVLLLSSALLADAGDLKRHDSHEARPAWPNAPLGLGELEEMAVRHNPTLAQAAAQIEASRGKALQAGLYPNPTVGYQGEQMGVLGTAGELQGGFIQQEIVTAGKL